jgi:AraC-like DNA-binding protein
MNVAQEVPGLPALQLRPYIRRYVGYHYSGFASGVHLGLPSPDLTVVFSFSEPTLVSLTENHSPDGFAALLSGLTLAPAFIHHDGNQFGVQLALTPLGARALFGLPAAAVAEAVASISLERLTDRLREASWRERFALLDAAFTQRLESPAMKPELSYAWQRITHSNGSLRVSELAAETGWSRRTLCARFAAEYGVGPKEALRLVRFGRSRSLVQQPNRPTLAEIAAVCGYYDQAHLAHEWRSLAGVAPSQWLEAEEFPISTSQADSSHATLVT